MGLKEKANELNKYKYDAYPHCPPKILPYINSAGHVCLMVVGRPTVYDPSDSKKSPERLGY